MFSDIRDFFHQQRFCFNSFAYTLIEVLIATAIFTSMVLLATMGLNQGLKQYHGLMEKGINFWSNAQNLWLNKSFSSVADYYVRTDDGKWFPYFRGTQDTITFVSLSPLAGDLPVVVWFRNEKEDDGTRCLVYNELPVYTKTSQVIAQDEIFSEYKSGQTIRILEDIQNVEFSYYGYDIQRKKFSWSNDYDGLKRKILPSLIKVSFSKEGRKNILLFGINVNSQLKMMYNEIYNQ